MFVALHFVAQDLKLLLTNSRDLLFKLLARIYGGITVEIGPYLLAVFYSLSTRKTLLRNAAYKHNIGIRLHSFPEDRVEKRFFNIVNLVIFVVITECEDCISHAAEVLRNLPRIRGIF